MSELAKRTAFAVVAVPMVIWLSWLGGAPLAILIATASGIASTFAELALYGLPLDEPERFIAALERATADDLLRLAQQYIDPEGACIVIVGDRAAIEPGLRELGLPKPELRDAEGERLPA